MNIKSNGVLGLFLLQLDDVADKEGQRGNGIDAHACFQVALETNVDKILSMVGAFRHLEQILADGFIEDLRGPGGIIHLDGDRGIFDEHLDEHACTGRVFNAKKLLLAGADDGKVFACLADKIGHQAKR